MHKTICKHSRTTAISSENFPGMAFPLTITHLSKTILRGTVESGTLVAESMLGC